MMVQIYIIFDNNSFMLQDLNIQSDKHELLKRAQAHNDRQPKFMFISKTCQYRLQKVNQSENIKCIHKSTHEYEYF